MKYLVTGGRGVIGSLIAKSRKSAGDEVLVIDDGTTKRHEFNDDNLTEFWKLGDPRCGNWREADKFDRILHAAASTGIPYSGMAPLDDWSRNVDGTIDILEAVRLSPRPTVVLSSVKPYKLSGLHALERIDRFALSGEGVSEAFPLEPDEPYAASKAAQSLICQAYARSYGLPVLVFRCSNLYGPAAPHGPRHGWATWITIQAALGWPVEIQGTGRQTRDLLFASDVERAALLAFNLLEGGFGNGEIYNLGGGSGNTISVLQLVELLKSFGAKFEVTSGPGRKHEDELFVTDTRAFERATGWKPIVGVEAGVRMIYEWARENRDALAGVYGEYAP